MLECARVHVHTHKYKGNSIRPLNCAPKLSGKFWAKFATKEAKTVGAAARMTFIAAPARERGPFP
jgi:hypothetical protein